MERRLLLAIVLSALVLFLFQAYYGTPPGPAPGASNQSPGAANLSPEAPLPAAASAASIAPPPPVVTLAVGETDEHEITVETQKARVVFTNRGARLRHWVLKDYRNEHGELLDLVPSSIPPNVPLPFALRADDAQTTATLNESLYRVSGAPAARIDASAQPASL